MTRQLRSNHTPDISKVKSEVAKIKKMVDDLYDMPFIPALVIVEVDPKIQVENI